MSPEQTVTPYAISLVLQPDGWKLFHVQPGVSTSSVPYTVSIGQALAIAKTATEQVINQVGQQQSPYDIVREGSVSLRTSIEGEIALRQEGLNAAQRAAQDIPALQQRLAELEKA